MWAKEIILKFKKIQHGVMFTFEKKLHKSHKLKQKNYS